MSQDVPKIVDALFDQLIDDQHCSETCACGQPLPSAKVMAVIVQDLKAILFPRHFGTAADSIQRLKIDVQSKIEGLKITIKEQIHRGLCYLCRYDQHQDCKDCLGNALMVTQNFIEALPEIKRLLNSDVKAAYDGDPAATCMDEAVFCYPGIEAMIHYRLAHELYKHKVPLIPRMMTEQAHSMTGIDIHPGASIGDGFFIDHGTGVVIGETAVIGNRVRLYQGVTLGAKSFPKDKDGKPVKGLPRHPVVEDDVIIYSEATILGRITIGKGSVIGGNVWVTRDVAPMSRISQAEVRQNSFERGEGI